MSTTARGAVPTTDDGEHDADGDQRADDVDPHVHGRRIAARHEPLMLLIGHRIARGQAQRHRRGPRLPPDGRHPQGAPREQREDPEDAGMPDLADDEVEVAGEEGQGFLSQALE